MRRTIATLIALALSGIAAAPVGAAPTSSTGAKATSLNIVCHPSAACASLQAS